MRSILRYLSMIGIIVSLLITSSLSQARNIIPCGSYTPPTPVENYQYWGDVSGMVTYSNTSYQYIYVASGTGGVRILRTPLNNPTAITESETYFCVNEFSQNDNTKDVFRVGQILFQLTTQEVKTYDLTDDPFSPSQLDVETLPTGQWKYLLARDGKILISGDTQIGVGSYSQYGDINQFTVVSSQNNATLCKPVFGATGQLLIGGFVSGTPSINYLLDYHYSGTNPYWEPLTYINESDVPLKALYYLPAVFGSEFIILSLTDRIVITHRSNMGNWYFNSDYDVLQFSGNDLGPAVAMTCIGEQAATALFKAHVRIVKNSSSGNGADLVQFDLLASPYTGSDAIQWYLDQSSPVFSKRNFNGSPLSIVLVNPSSTTSPIYIANGPYQNIVVFNGNAYRTYTNCPGAGGSPNELCFYRSDNSSNTPVMLFAACERGIRKISISMTDPTAFTFTETDQILTSTPYSSICNATNVPTNGVVLSQYIFAAGANWIDVFEPATLTRITGYHLPGVTYLKAMNFTVLGTNQIIVFATTATSVHKLRFNPADGSFTNINQLEMEEGLSPISIDLSLAHLLIGRNNCGGFRPINLNNNQFNIMDPRTLGHNTIGGVVFYSADGATIYPDIISCETTNETPPNLPTGLHQWQYFRTVQNPRYGGWTYIGLTGTNIGMVGNPRFDYVYGLTATGITIANLRYHLQRGVAWNDGFNMGSYDISDGRKVCMPSDDWVHNSSFFGVAEAPKIQGRAFVCTNSGITAFRHNVVQITTPNPGDRYRTNSIPVRWREYMYSTNSTPQAVNILVSYNSGNTWSTLATNVTGDIFSPSFNNTYDCYRERVYFAEVMTGQDHIRFRVENSTEPNIFYDESTGDISVSFGSIVKQTARISGSFCVFDVVEPPSNDTLKIDPGAGISFTYGGKIHVPSGTVVQFMGHDSAPTPIENYAFLIGHQNDAPSIEVEEGGKVIGGFAKFVSFSNAIKSTGGQIQLDSAEFENCATAISVNSLADTVALSHCTFTGGEKAISSFDALDGSYQSITSCNFNNQSVKALELWKPKETTINGCNIVGNNNSTIGIDLYTTSSKVQIDNSEISNCTIGVNGLYSEAQFYNNLVHNNRDAAFVWSNGGGRIDHCNISDNGINATNYKSGFFGYAASTIFTCNSFSGNDHHAVYLTGNSTASFYDPDNSQVGSNDFSGILDFPMVLVDNSTPVFLYGENTFTGIIDQNGNHLNYYMQQVGTPFYLNLKGNSFDKDPNPLGGLLPSNGAYWGLNTVFDSSSCGTNLGDYMSDLGGSLLRGDIYFSQDMLDSALYYYNLTLAQSGDSTAAGAAALQRLSELNPQLPPVGDPYSMTKYYNESYGFDAMHEFLTADAFRDSILAYGNGDDSLRIEYDMLVSSLLRPTPASKRGDIAGYYQTQQSNRMTALSKIAKLSKAIKPPSHETAVAIPKAFTLSSIYPNPFNNTTQIRFEVPKSSRVSVSVYDALGRLVKTLADKDYTTGSYRINWDGNNSSGMKVSTGIYFITMKTPGFVATKKAILLK